MELKQRSCLKCGELFDSEGSWNRICKKCREKNRSIYIPKLRTSKLMLSGKRVVNE